MLEKSETPPASDWVMAQCAKFEHVLAPFVGEMRAAFRRKAEEGRRRWDQPEAAKELYDAALAHMVAIPLASTKEADLANFMAFLFALRLQRETKSLPALSITAGEFRPTHRHVEGGLYQVVGTLVNLHTGPDTWTKAIRYRDEYGEEFVRWTEDFNARFEPIGANP